MDIIGIPGIAAIAPAPHSPLGDVASDPAPAGHPLPSNQASQPSDFLSTAGAASAAPTNTANFSSISSPSRLRAFSSSPAPNVPLLNAVSNTNNSARASPADIGKTIPATSSTHVRFGEIVVEPWDSSFGMDSMDGAPTADDAAVPDDPVVVPVSGETPQSRKRRLACIRQRRRRQSMKKKGSVEEEKSLRSVPEKEEKYSDESGGMNAKESAENRTVAVHGNARSSIPAIARSSRDKTCLEGTELSRAKTKPDEPRPEKSIATAAVELGDDLRSLDSDDMCILPAAKRIKIDDNAANDDEMAEEECLTSSPNTSPKESIEALPESGQTISSAAGESVSSSKAADKVVADQGRTSDAIVEPSKPKRGRPSHGTDQEAVPLNETSDERKRRLAKLRQRRRRSLLRSTKVDSKNVAEPVLETDTVADGERIASPSSSPLDSQPWMRKSGGGWKEAGFASESDANICVDSAVSAVAAIAGSGLKRSFVVHGCLQALAKRIGLKIGLPDRS